MKFMDRLSSNDLAHSLDPHCLVDADVAKSTLAQSGTEVRTLCKRMTAPLVTMLSAEPEIQYVAWPSYFGG